MQGAEDVGADGADRVALVVDRRRRAGEVVQAIGLEPERFGHVVAHEAETLVRGEVRDVALRATREVVEADDVVPVGEEAIAQVRADETRAAGYDATHLLRR